MIFNSSFGARSQRVNYSDIFTRRLRSEIPIALRALCDALVDKAELRELDLSDNAFGPVGVEAFAPLLENNRGIAILRINNNGLGPSGGVRLAKALKTAVEKNEAAGHKNALKTFVCGRNRLENEAATALSDGTMSFSKRI